MGMFDWSRRENIWDVDWLPADVKVVEAIMGVENTKI